MTVSELSELLLAEDINLPDGNKEIKCGYCGDFLSFVMGKAPTDCAWFTVMSNVNVCAVATLAEVAVVVLCESVKPDAALLDKVKIQGVNLISTDYDVFSAVKLVADKV